MDSINIALYACIQWNHWQRTAPITETSTMLTIYRSPESFPIVYCMLQSLYTGNLPTPNYGHQSHAQWKKSIQISLWKQIVSTYWHKSWKLFAVLEDFSHFYPFYVSRPLYTQGTLNLQHVAYNDWKRSSHYWVHSLYKGYLSVMDTSAWSRGVCNSEVPL